MGDVEPSLLTPEAGKHWKEAGVSVTCSAKSGCLAIEGYRDNITPGAMTDTVKEVYEKTYPMDQPVQITWQYASHRYDVEVTIGNPVELSASTLKCPEGETCPEVLNEVIGQTATDVEPLKPTSADSSEVDQKGEELYYWSSSDKKLFPLIGDRTFQLEWQSKEGGDCDQKLITTITTKWPETAHYEHVAETLPVPLDPRGDDEFAFDSLKYAENDAAVSQSLDFTASEPGRTTLLFTKAESGAAVGDLTTEKAYVRVVETRTWNQKIDADTAEIGKEITHEAHDAATHNGYVFWEKSRYNANVYDRETMQGQIFPVNQQFTSSNDDDLVVIWYDERDNILWPSISVKYACQWPSETKRIVIASQMGSECKGSDGVYPTWPDRNGEPKEYLDPARYKRLKIYQQPDPNLPGYNPNEEHALIASSFREEHKDILPQAVFALRDDLNITSETVDGNPAYTSDNYVLLQYYDVIESKHGMELFDIEREDPANGYEFIFSMKAGDLVEAPYPLNQVIGGAPPTEICGRNGNPARNCYWKDHKGQSWAVSGNAHLFAYFWYPLAPSFWYDKDENKENEEGYGIVEGPGDPVPWLPTGTVTSDDDAFPEDMLGKAKAIEVRYNTKWPDEVPVLKAGETLTFAGGEYRADHPGSREGLPMVLGWAAGQVVFDDANPDMEKDEMYDSYLVRLVQALEKRTVELSVDDMPEDFKPAAGKVKVVSGLWYFKELHSGLKTRFFYDPLTEELGILGFLNGKTLGDDGLTNSPPSVYVLQPNILTNEEWKTIEKLEGANDAFKGKVKELYNLTRDPANLKDDEGAYTVGLSDARKELESYHETLFEKQFDDMCASLHSLCQNCGFDTICEAIKSGSDTGDARPFPEMALGKGLALVPNAVLMDPNPPLSEGYVTLAENNNPALGNLPVALHIIKVVNDKYRGAIKTIKSDNVFDEKITLRHTADFGANPGDVVFQWRYREDDGTKQPPPGDAPSGTWKSFPGDGPEVAMTGAGAALLVDNFFFCRYRHEESDGNNPASWSDWAGAANSRPPKDEEDPSETFEAQLAEGWVKRVTNGLNPFEARIKDFYSSDSPATYTSMITQAGQRFEGAVAFNPDKDVIENIGLIELYQTVLNRAEDLSINMEGSTTASSGLTAAMLLAASRIAGFYTLLGNEAYTDALDPTIGFGTDSVEYGSLAPAIFTFMNQVPTLLDEELELLRGRDEEGARPAYNRLLWNFTKAEGEAAYALSYSISDVNKDGFINEADGRATYPQGHGATI